MGLLVEKVNWTLSMLPSTLCTYKLREVNLSIWERLHNSAVRFGEIIIMHKVIEHYGLYSESSQQQILSVDEGLLYWKLIAARISGKQIP